MVSELRGRPPSRHRSRRGRTSQRRSVFALPKAAFVRKRANQGGTTANSVVLVTFCLKDFFYCQNSPERSVVPWSIIQIQHLYKTFGTGENAVHALEDISLDIQKGEIFGIIGLSGAGKSTLVRCMNLLERPTSGTVIVDGKDMTALSEKRAAAGPSERHHDLPELQPADAADGAEKRLLPHGAQRYAPPPRPESGPWSCWTWWACGRKRTPIPPSSPADRSSGWPSPGPWPRTPRSCCVTKPPLP